MKIAIIGTGGVGGFFGGKLALAGNDVAFLARGAHLEAIKKNGLTVQSILGDFHVDQFMVTDRITEIDKPDLVILAVKAWQIQEVRNALRKIIHQDTVILPLQNGVSAAEDLTEAIAPSNILGGLCRIISKIDSPGVIHHFGVTPSIVFGEFNNTNSSRAQKIKALFDQAGIDAEISKDIASDLWKKFIAICVGGLLAVTRATYGELREIPQTRQLMIDLLTEVYMLSQAAGARIGSDYVDKAMAFVDSLPHNSTSSLARDVWEGRPSEIDYKNGAVVHLGEKYGVATPVNRFIYDSILPMELKARGLT